MTLSRLDAAERRLHDALARFETALAQASRRKGGLVDEEVTELRGECRRLSDALGAAHEANASLRQLSDEAANRLDQAIGQIDNLLED